MAKQYSVYTVSRDGKSFRKNKTSFEEYYDAVASMRTHNAFLEEIKGNKYCFISNEMNESRGLPTNTISFFIEEETSQ